MHQGVIRMQSPVTYVTYYFDIDSMTCSTCTSAIKNCLKGKRKVKEVHIDLAMLRAAVVVQKEMSPQTIIDLIGDVGFQAKLILPEHERRLYFSIKGLKTSKDADKIMASLNNDETNFDNAKNDKDNDNKEDKDNDNDNEDDKVTSDRKAYIKNCDVNYSTSTVTIYTSVDTTGEKLQKLQEQCIADIKAALPRRKMTVEVIQAPINEELNKIDSKQLYFRKALINLIFGLPLWLFGSIIPLPLTVAGQLVGLCIGGTTLAIMWQTGKEFYKRAWQKFWTEYSFDMHTLIALGTGSAWIYSMLVVLAPLLFPLAALQYQFLAVNTILGFVNIGLGIRSYAQERVKRKVQDLGQVYVKLQPQVAKKLDLKKLGKYPTEADFNRKDLNEYLVQINYRDIQEGDILLVTPGSRTPVEGVILSDNETTVNQETLTGESRLRAKKKGDDVTSGSLNNKERIFIRATRNGTQGYLTKIIEGAVETNKANKEKRSISEQVDRIAVWFVPAIISLALFSAAGWFFLGPTPVLPWMIKSALAVLLCACPCALLMATPISYGLAVAICYSMGILITDQRAIGVTANVNTVVIDKTGTLTTLRRKEIFAEKWNEEEVGKYVSSLEQGCLQKGFDHPIARSLLTDSQPYPCTDVKKNGQGVFGKVNGRWVYAGTLGHLEANGISVPAAYKKQEDENGKKGLSSVYVAIDKECVAVIALEHDIREDAAKTIKDLFALGIDVIMLTGDKKEPAWDVARQLGISKVEWGKTPEMKKAYIENLKKQEPDRCIAMVGDGLNDIGSLSAADVSFAAGSWTEASSTAMVAIQNINLVPFILIARETRRNIHQNLLWTAFYNTFSLAAASGILYPLFGFVLNPIIASMAMAFSSISVVLNSSRLTDQINYRLGVYEGIIPKPATFIQKLTHLLSFKSLINAIKGIMFFDEHQSVPIPTRPLPLEKHISPHEELFFDRKAVVRARSKGKPLFRQVIDVESRKQEEEEEEELGEVDEVEGYDSFGSIYVPRR